MDKQYSEDYGDISEGEDGTVLQSLAHDDVKIDNSTFITGTGKATANTGSTPANGLFNTFDNSNKSPFKNTRQVANDDDFINILQVNNLDDPNETKDLSKRLKSPRTLEAMNVLGIKAVELEPVSYNNVRKFIQKRERSQTVQEDLVKVRYEMMNEKRHK